MGSVVQSETEIANMALDMLVEEPITNFETDTRSIARWMKRNYASVRDSLLRSHPWRFAIKRVEIVKITTDPDYGWDYQYQVPDDCVRVLPLTEDGELDGEPIRYVVEGGKIRTDASSPIKLLYVARITNTTLFDPSFVQALVHMLALKAAYWLTGKQSLAKELEAQAPRVLGEARLIDSLEGTPPPTVDSDILYQR